MSFSLPKALILGVCSLFVLMGLSQALTLWWFQQQLQRLGYTTPQSGTLDRATINVLAAFQMHYRPARHDGQPDAETAAIMLAML